MKITATKITNKNGTNEKLLPPPLCSPCVVTLINKNTKNITISMIYIFTIGFIKFKLSFKE
jgi:hypothetical protein